MPKAQTIKQAKAEYKSRGQNSLTARQRRQVERNVQLERRAWGVRERDKRREESLKQRALEEAKARADERQTTGLLGSQRKRDRFGNKSSQYHLGAFFTRCDGGASKAADVGDDLATRSNQDHGAEQFGEADLDDETLLEALYEVQTLKGPDNLNVMPPPSEPAITRDWEATAHLSLNTDEDACLLEAFTMDSSTQIARELNGEFEHTATSIQPKVSKTRESTIAEDVQWPSFSSESFDFSLEDLERLECFPSTGGHSKAEEDAERSLMPPPAIPVKPSKPLTHTPPEIVGFTFTQLESFVEDDIQLTQF